MIHLIRSEVTAKTAALLFLFSMLLLVLSYAFGSEIAYQVANALFTMSLLGFLLAAVSWVVGISITSREERIAFKQSAKEDIEELIKELDNELEAEKKGHL